MCAFILHSCHNSCLWPTGMSFNPVTPPLSTHLPHLFKTEFKGSVTLSRLYRLKKKILSQTMTKNARRTEAMLVMIESTNSKIKDFIVGINQNEDIIGLTLSLCLYPGQCLVACQQLLFSYFGFLSVSRSISQHLHFSKSRVSSGNLVSLLLSSPASEQRSNLLNHRTVGFFSQTES